MKKYKRDIIHGVCLSLIFNLVALILLPVIVFLIFSLFSGTDEPDYDSIIREEIPDYINVYITESGVVEKIDFEDYIKGVVASEMPSSFEIEALKAQAVAARTYSLSKVLRSGENGFPSAHPSAPLCNDVHCQVYRSEESLRAVKGDAWMDEGYEKIKTAVDSTKGEVMYYDGVLVSQALFHSSSGGKTENSEDVFASAVPYLRSVDSPYEDEATHKNEEKSFKYSDAAALINKKYPDRETGTLSASDFEIKERTSGGRVERIVVGKSSYSGRELREALSLSSANFTVEASGDTVTFTTTGFGHGVGMSQYGANGMAKEGYGYKEILKHYYTGVVVY